MLVEWKLSNKRSLSLNTRFKPCITAVTPPLTMLEVTEKGLKNQNGSGSQRKGNLSQT